MANKKLWLQNIPLHPFFFASYPVLALLASILDSILVRSLYFNGLVGIPRSKGFFVGNVYS